MAPGWVERVRSGSRQATGERRPLSDPSAARRGAPFAGVAIVAVVVELMTTPTASNLPMVTAVVVVMTVLFVAALAIPWRRLPAWCEAVVPLGFFVVVAMLRNERVGASSGYPPLVMLPVVWLAIYGTRAQLRLALAALAASLAVPLLVVGPPHYPASGWGLSILTVAVGAVAGPAIQRLVERSRQRTADVAALGAITRALTAGADPRPQLCAAAALVTAAEFALLFEPTSDGMLVATAGTVGLDLTELRVDQRAETSATARVWRSGRRLYVADAVADPLASSHFAGLTDSVSVLFEPVTRDGNRMAVLVVGYARFDARIPTPALDMIDLVAAEIAAALDRAALVALLEEQARTDPLTGAANRRSWDEALDRELARAERSGEPLTVAMIDMDHFKRFNDTHGHNAGDGVLRDLVTALRAELRTSDVVARWGGEEFALALPDCDLAQAELIAARILNVIPCGQTVSIGLTQAAHTDTPRSLVGRADLALYAAKSGGRNQVAVLRPTAAVPTT